MVTVKGEVAHVKPNQKLNSLYCYKDKLGNIKYYKLVVVKQDIHPSTVPTWKRHRCEKLLLMRSIEKEKKRKSSSKSRRRSSSKSRRRRSSRSSGKSRRRSSRSSGKSRRRSSRSSRKRSSSKKRKATKKHKVKMLI